MVGLSVVLEPHKNGTQYPDYNTAFPHIITNKIPKPPSPASSAPPCFHLYTPTAAPAAKSSVDINSFLEICFLCRLKLLPSKDIYIYKGETAFCSEECRSEHIASEEKLGQHNGRRRRPAGIRVAGRSS